jgi:death-on-curing protein
VSPSFLTLDEVLAIHASRVDRYGGQHGIRDVGLLESAIAMPSSTFGGEWLHPTIAEMAAAYLFHIVKNHPFIDGNKRAALATAGVFLAINGYELIADEVELGDFVLGVAEGRVSKAEASVFLARHAQPR